jgi:hypothetical protein
MDSIPFPGWSPYGIIIFHLFCTIFRVDSIWNELNSNITTLNVFYYINYFREGGWTDWWLPLLSNNLGLSLGHQIYNTSIFVKGISMVISLIFHCDFSIVCLSISLGYFKCMPGDIIVIFQLYARGFHCDFSIVGLGISLGYFKCMPGYFIGIFQLYARGFHWDISIICLTISM